MRKVWSLAAAAVAAALVSASTARAEDAPVPPAVDLEADTRTETPAAEAAPEAPPPPPYHKTLVLDASVGALAFLGAFGKVAPTAPWLHAQVGYELLDWLMVLGEGDLAFTDTSRMQDPPATRAFPIFGFGAGARFTWRLGRVGVCAQASVGGMKADIAKNALGILGFGDAESLGVYAAARLGVEWYQIDRHFALGLTSGLRSAQGFARVGRGSDSPLALDGGASLRYAF